jgi:hypothetical protein
MNKLLLILSLLLCTSAYAQDVTITLPAGTPVCLPYKMVTSHGEFSDSICDSASVIAKLLSLPDGLLSIKTSRAQNWIAFVIEQSSKPPIVPTKAELQEQLLAKEKEVEDLKAKIATVEKMEP